MAIVELHLDLDGVSLPNVDLYPDGSDTAAATNVSLTAATNRTATYTFTNGSGGDTNLTGLHKVEMFDDATFIGWGWIDLVTDSVTIVVSSSRREAAYLDKAISALNDLSQAQANAACDTALSDAGVTTTRMGYLDNANVGGLLASSSEVTAITNSTRCVRVVPSPTKRPESGTVEYKVELLLYDNANSMEAPDEAPTIGVENAAGTSRNSRLDSTTMTFVSTGRYRSIYTASNTDDIEQLLWTFNVVEGGNTRIYRDSTMVVDDITVDYTASDRMRDDAIKATVDNFTFTGGDVHATLDGETVTVGTNNDKSGYSLSASGITAVQSGLSTFDASITGVTLTPDGLDSVSITRPAGVAGNFREQMVEVFWRFFGKVTLTKETMSTYGDDGTTVLTTQDVSDDGVTQTQGKAS